MKRSYWNRFKAVKVESDDQLLHLTRYLHLNPVTAYLVDKPEDWQASSYKEYLQTPEWAKIRKQAFKKSNFKCELCYKGGELHTHHKRYPKRGTETQNDIIVLCRACHAHHHHVLEN